MPERDELDHILDQALASYGRTDAAMPRRLLARVQTEIAAASAPRRRWLPFAFALPVVALLVLALWLVPIRYPGTMLPGPQAKAPAAPAPVLHRPLPERVRQPQPRAPRPAPQIARAATPARPKLEVFPTPQPLSGSLAAFAAAASQLTPPQAQALLAGPAAPDAPITIAKIDIAPLDPTGEGGR